MNPVQPILIARPALAVLRPCWMVFWLRLLLGLAGGQAVADTVTNGTTAAVNTPGFNITAYQVQGKYPLAPDLLQPLLAPYTGTNVSLEQIRHAAFALESEYARQGYSTMNVVVAPKKIKDGVVVLDAFVGALPQVVVGGYRFAVSSNGVEVALTMPANLPPPSAAAPQPAAKPAKSSSKFTVNCYQVEGNTLLPADFLNQIITNTPGVFGTNVEVGNIQEVVKHLRAAYLERGYATVYVGLPQQRLTNATVKLEVVEGRLSSITVKGNRYFSTENVLRAMPGLYTNMILNSLTFQAELNRANANQDRQIYPVIEPGPDPGTSDLTLQVKDRLPLHAKTELNNQSSPGTPSLRENSSAVYNNLWQQEQSLGVQYSFSPEQYKEGNQWKFYDLPSVANYSTFYRIPLGSPRAVDDLVAANPGTFGYSEATHKFNLPPISGQPDLTFFASRSTIDNGVTTTPEMSLYTSTSTNSDGSVTTNNSLTEISRSQDLTINNDFGFRFNYPLLSTADTHFSYSGGLDFKTYAATSTKTNNFFLATKIIDTIANYTNNNYSTVTSSIPLSYSEVYYLPLSLRYDIGWRDFLGSATLGLGLSANLWYSALYQNIAINTNNSITTTSIHRVGALQTISGSADSTGHWLVLTPSFSHTFELVTNWMTTLRADGQWASEPLISNEQFGAGGVNSVRGYQEGEVFGDTGWHVSLEQQTPPHTVGMIRGRIPLIIRGTLYTDYARVYLLDPKGRDDDVGLWGTGAGCVASLGTFWETRFLFSVPMLSTPTTTAYHPYFNFSLTAQF